MTEAIPGRDATVDAVDALWRHHRAGHPDARDRLIIHYSGLVKYVAGRLGAGLPATVDPQDLASYGMFGLIDAVDRYDPDRPVRFESFATMRIRGAIIDELRRLDWVPRRVRANSRRLTESLAELEQQLERSATEVELADHMGIEVDEVRSILDDVAAGGTVALDDLGMGTEGRPVWEVLADPSATDPGDDIDRQETRRLLLETVRALPERERHIVALYYFESMTLAQIGDVLGVTESRISQLHAKAVLSLRNRLSRVFAD